MKKFKKVVASVLTLAMIGSVLTACGKDGTDVTASSEISKKTLRIYAWNDEFQSRFKDYFEKPGKLPEGITVEWVITPNEGNAYQNKLDEALRGQDSSTEKLDIFLVEADYALKYVNSDYSLDVIGDVGLTDADLADQYQYTKDIVTNSQGKLKGVTWQATPGLFAYRRSIAKEVLGTDDPDEVQTYLSDWDKFSETAAKAKDKGYFMLSGFDDAYRTFSNNVSAPWVDANKKIVIDPNIEKWIDQTKEFTDKGYNEKTSLWDDNWNAGQGPNGKVFGYFYSTWGINFTLLGNSLETPTAEGGKAEVGNGAYGDYAVVAGPQSYFWGGTWICAAKGGDNIDLVKDVMKVLTTDKDTMKKITEDTQDYTNNKTAMGEIAASDFKSDFLGGQNHIALFAEAATKIDMSNISSYDQALNEALQGAMKDYFNGNATKEEAYDLFYKTVGEKHAELVR